MSDLATLLIGLVAGLVFSYGLVSIKAHRPSGKRKAISRRSVIEQSLYLWSFVVVILVSMIYSPSNWWIVLLGGELLLCVVAAVIVTRRRKRHN